MFSYTKKIITAASLLAICSGQLYAMHTEGTDEDEARNRTALIAINDLNPDALRSILERVSKVHNPGRISRVCRDWHSLIQGDIMKYMKIWWSIEDPKRFYKGILHCTPPQDGAVVDLSFANLKNNNGIFSLPADIASHIRVMNNVEEFCKTGGDNAHRTLVLAVLHSEAEKAAVTMSENHPFVQVVKNWDLTQAAVGVFIREGNDDVKKRGFRHLTDASLVALSSLKSLLELTQKARASCWWANLASCRCDRVHFSFLNQNKDYCQEPDDKKSAPGIPPSSN